MKHTLQLTAPFVATIDDSTRLGKSYLQLFAVDPVAAAKILMSSTLLTDEFDSYMASMNEGGYSVVVALDKPAFI